MLFNPLVRGSSPRWPMCAIRRRIQNKRNSRAAPIRRVWPWAGSRIAKRQRGEPAAAYTISSNMRRGCTKRHTASPRIASRTIAHLTAGRRRLGVKRVGLTMCRSLPVFTYEQTSLDPTDWSVSCQNGHS
jgi:hypothetical protein